MGYYNNEETTSKVLKDGWFFTGDLGYLDKDKFLHITGRKKNVIVTKNGKNIFPEEIEILLNRSPFISESLIYSENNAESGDLIVSAIMVPNFEKIQELNEVPLTGEYIYNIIKKEVKSVNSNLVTYKHIKNFNLRDEEFSKTTTKKIKRYIESNKTFRK